MKKLILLSLLICAALSAAELRIVRQPANGKCKVNEETEFKIVYSGASAKSVSVAFLGNGVTEKVTLPLEKANGEITLKRTMNVPGKAKRMGAARPGRTKDWKKAIVQLTEDSKTIEMFEGMV